MERLTKMSFSVLKVTSFGILFIYLFAAITVGAAGHDSWNSLSFLFLFVYSVCLMTMLFKYQKNKSKAIGKFLLIWLIPAIALLTYYLFMILADILFGKGGMIGIKIMISSVCALFIASSILVIRRILLTNPNT
jgi:hypothetical protein